MSKNIDDTAKMRAIENIILGNSLAVNEMRKLIEMVAGSNTTVLIQGETGTGKELVAEALHVASGREGSNISVNCAAIPSDLLESELFGHEKGAFTGADRSRPGRFEQADRGTIFLDEIGDMPLPLQSKLLRVLEGRRIQRVGSNKEINVDFRLVCATHQDLNRKVEKGEFRADLYYRINVFPVEVPTLAMRTVDVPILIAGIIEKLKFAGQNVNVKFNDDALKVLANYSWPGNVRELRNVVERATVLFNERTVTGENVKENLLRLKVPDPQEEQDELWAASADLVDVSKVTDDIKVESLPIPKPEQYKDWFLYFDKMDLRRHLSDIEVVMIEAALEKTNGMVSQASDALRLRRTTLIEKMKKYGIAKYDRV
ncbi:sigma-54 dependent transcriptional regulator [Paracoccaceae bacterium]|nr:sigma-54 dependent transcriptional regulator [Paracoccaceae bacterium]